MNQPENYNFLPHYREDGLRAFTIRLKQEGGAPIDLTGATVRMQLRAKYTGKLVYEFSSDSSGNSLLTLEPAGVIRFPEIKSWDLQASTYDYDLEVTDSTGFVRTYLRGSWSVNQDITKRAV